MTGEIGFLETKNELLAENSTFIFKWKYIFLSILTYNNFFSIIRFKSYYWWGSIIDRNTFVFLYLSEGIACNSPGTRSSGIGRGSPENVGASISCRAWLCPGQVHRQRKTGMCRSQHENRVLGIRYPTRYPARYLIVIVAPRVLLRCLLCYVVRAVARAAY